MSCRRLLTLLLCLILAVPAGGAFFPAQAMASETDSAAMSSPNVAQNATSASANHGGCHGRIDAGAAVEANASSTLMETEDNSHDCCSDSCLCGCLLPSLSSAAVDLVSVVSEVIATQSAGRHPAHRQPLPPLRPPIA
jgi:hypothetical protein